ncbi:MAG TPA: hypothetical protein VMB02_06050 [Candidatus Aquilonibacter sp.]|nr:hypothetical protein [Candidatus Aquilonibacter sp.]
MICPQCRSADCFRSRRNGLLDFFAGWTALRPWRCRTCDFRFYARSVAVSFARYAHCPRCGNFDLQHISRDRVEKGNFLFLKRALGFAAYRCDPCREKFFTVLPFRRILPSMMPAAERRVSGI